MAPAREYNPVTGVKEAYFPQRDRLTRMFTASMVIVIMVSKYVFIVVMVTPLSCVWLYRVLTLCVRVCVCVRACVCMCVQLCVVLIFLVTVIMYRGIISVMMFHTGNPVLRTQVPALILSF